MAYVDRRPRKGKRPVVFVVGPSIAYVCLTQGQHCLIDVEDATWIGRNNWNAHWSKKMQAFYACRGGRVRCKPYNISMHRLVCGEQGLLHVDHANGNTLDNRRCNIRSATPSQNNCNASLRRDNTTGLKGVSRKKSKWQANIRVDGHQKFLGLFPTPESAHAAYCSAAHKYHGEFARTA